MKISDFVCNLVYNLQSEGKEEQTKMWRTFIDSMEEWSNMANIGRLTLSILIGTLIGIDRGLKRRGAGIKRMRLCVWALLSSC